MCSTRTDRTLTFRTNRSPAEPGDFNRQSADPSLNKGPVLMSGSLPLYLQLLLLRLLLFILVVLQLSAFSNALLAQDRDRTSLREVIAAIEEQSDYRFLYRDALIAGKYCTLPNLNTSRNPNQSPDRNANQNLNLSPNQRPNADSNQNQNQNQHQLQHPDPYPDRYPEPQPGANGLAGLAERLLPHRIDMSIDTVRRQVILFEIRNTPAVNGPISLHGQVLDARTGSRLPFATVSWSENGRIRGTAANEAGHFQLRVEPGRAGSASGVIQLTATYLGYDPVTIEIDPAQPPGELSIRLEPSGFYSSEVIITGTHSVSASDTVWRNAAGWGTMPAVGDRSTIRYLSPLPSVSMSGALSDGLIVRGSKSDGFQVLLDGIQIFNQNHFFGLFDAFNADALQTVGFFYDIAPASLTGTPGGTLSVLTRTGSQQNFGAQSGLSSTTLRGSAEGPVASGRGSWLIAGRTSVMDPMSWFSTTDLVAWGLDVGRPTSSLPTQYDNPESRVLFPGDTRAMFYDLHGKFYYEWSRGRRLTVNAYIGGDHTTADAGRLVFNPDALLPRNRFVPVDVRTENRWGNSAGTIHFQTPAGPGLYLHTMAGFSLYDAEFSKDDFVYQRGLQAAAGQRNFVGAFRNENALLEVKGSQYADILTSGAGSLTAGYAVHYWNLRYEEDSAFNAGYFNESESLLADLFVQHDWKDNPWFHTWAGLRSHWYSNGRYLYLSPRFQFRLLPEQILSVGGGYSRNYQFLHKLSLQNIQTAAFWILTDKFKEPTISDHWSAGIYLNPGYGTFVQAELFLKDQRNLRYHQINNRMLITGITNLNYPWFMNNESLAKGLELMYRQQLGRHQFTHSYTLSEVTWRNDVINNGEEYYPEWDRRHQYSFSLSTPLGAGFGLRGLWTSASGAANVHVTGGADDVERLQPYHRLDLGIGYERRLGRTLLEMQLAAYNVLDRKNTLYREPVMVIDRSTRLTPEAKFVFLDVYDLGFQPSFEIRVRF
jgi:hypothetical protein